MSTQFQSICWRRPGGEQRFDLQLPNEFHSSRQVGLHAVLSVQGKCGLHDITERKYESMSMGRKSFVCGINVRFDKKRYFKTIFMKVL